MKSPIKTKFAYKLFAIFTILFLALAAMPVKTAYAAACTFTSGANGNWNTAATWSAVGTACSSYPGQTFAGDTVIISAGNTVTVTAAVPQNLGAVTINGTLSNTLTFNLSTLASLTINAGGIANIYRPLTVTGATNITGTINFASTNTTGRTMTFTGPITLNSGAAWNEAAAGNGTANIFIFQSNFINNATTFNGATPTGSHTFAGGTISGSTATSWTSLTIVSGNTTNSGTLTVTGGANSRVFVNDAVTFTNNGTISTDWLTVTGPTGVLANNGTVTVGSTNNLDGTGTFTNNATGTLILTGALTITTLNASAAGNNVYYSRAINQNVYPTTYSNLYFAGAAVKTFTAVTTVTGNLDIAGPPPTLSLGGFTHPVNTLTFNGVPQASGTWGNTGSGATHIDATRFTNTLGVLNVAGTPPAFTSAAPAGGTVNQAYSHTYTATGTPPINFALTAGAFPPGLSLAGAVLSGTPTTAGTYTGTVTASNTFLPNATQNFSITIAQATTTTAITSDLPDPSVVGQAVPVAFTVTGQFGNTPTAPTGNVTVSDGTISCTATVAVGSCNLTFTTPGARNLTATYAGDTNFTGSTSAIAAHTVNPATTTTTITSDLPDPSVVGQAVPVNFTVAVAAPGAGTPTGNVTVSDGSISCTATIAAGTCSLTFTTAGAHNLTATYAGDANFAGSTSATEAHTVNPAATTTTITSDLPDPSVVGQAVPVNFTVAVVAPGAGTPTGNVTVGDGTISCTATVAAGTCSLTFTTVGARNLTATYAGDADFAGSTSAIVGHTVNQASTTTTITADLPDPSVVGQAVPVNFNVAVNGPGAGTPTGNVTVSDGSISCTATLAAGTCSLTFTTAGARTLTATYAGDANFATSTSVVAAHTVNPADTTTTITSDAPDASVVGQAVTVNYAVAVSAPGAGVPTGNVTVSDGLDSCTGTVAAGTCNITFLTAGPRNLTATYAGDTNFNGSVSALEPHTVNQAGTTTTITSDLPDPSVVGQAVPVIFNVAVTAPGVGTPTGNVTVSDGTISCTATVAAGTCSLTFTTAGPRNLTATYAGDASFAGSTSAVEAHTVNQASTTTTITSDLPDPSFVGQAVPVNFNVAVTAPGAGTPTGNVTVSDGTISCTATVAAGTCSLTFTTTGAHNLTATYAGDADFAGSASALEAHTVNQGSTTITIASDLPDPSYEGSPVTVVFNVAVLAPASGSPTGIVTVTDGVDTCTDILPATSCSITLTTVGGRFLTATYAGDTNFGGSTSLPEPHQVLALIAPAITSALPAAGTVNDPYTHTFTATGSPAPTFSLVGTLPAGLTWNGVDTISGTPTAAGTSGSITVTATNGVLPDATQTFTITINQAITTTAITSDTPDPSAFGEAVPVNFTVTGQFGNAPTAPTGNVTVTDSASVASCTAPAAAGTCSITFTSLGARNLTATYAGDTNFTGSASATVAHDVVQAGTTTTITSDLPDPSDVGSAITVNYSVTVNAPGTGTPTGTVTITDSLSAATCSASVVAGTCSITFTTVGARSLTATYGGDTNFAVSVSALEPHAVNPISSTVTTQAATGMNTTSATLHATVNANFDSTAVTFEYGLTVAYGSVVAGVPSPVTGNTNTAVSAFINGLTPNTLYHFRAIGLNGAGTTYGGDLTFSTTPIVYPTVASSNPANNAVLTAGPMTLVVNFNKDVVHDGSVNAADNVVNYRLVGVGANSVFNTVSCLLGLGGDDVNYVINTAAYDNNGGAGPFRATLGINGGVPLPVGTYRLFVCGSTSIRDDEGYILNNGVDGEVTFTVQQVIAPAALPATGFAPDRVTFLPTQPADKAYAALGSLWMEIPSLNVKMSIVGVPQTKGDWDVSWLGSQAGWLQGTAFPTWVGNSVVTAHVTDANGKNGPFALLKNLMYGDQIIVHMNGQKYTYEVRSTRTVAPGSTSYVFQKLEKYSYLTLLTCKDYNPLTNKYASREVIRAVLVSISTDK